MLDAFSDIREDPGIRTDRVIRGVRYGDCSRGTPDPTPPSA
ncbi:hypothetical protein ACFVX6_17170 [Streptomyces sp. NPDC058289]